MYATWIFWIGWINIHKWKSLSIESNPISTKISLCIRYYALYAPCPMLMLKYASLVILFKLLNVNASNWIVYWTLRGGISQNSQIMNKLSLFNQSCFGVQTHIKWFESRYFKETHSSFGSFFLVTSWIIVRLYKSTISKKTVRQFGNFDLLIELLCDRSHRGEMSQFCFKLLIFFFQELFIAFFYFIFLQKCQKCTFSIKIKPNMEYLINK